MNSSIAFSILRVIFLGKISRHGITEQEVMNILSLLIAKLLFQG